MNLFYKRIALRLVDIERKRSWLLAKTGIRPSTWSSWEKNDRFPPTNRAVAIADALGVSVEYLVTGRESPFDFRGDNPLIGEISQVLPELREDQLRHILTTANTMILGESG